MKKKIARKARVGKILALCLCLALALGCGVAVASNLVSAAETGRLYLNRTFDDGLGSKGFTPVRGVQTVETDGSNSFYRIKGNSGEHAYIEVTTNTQNYGDSKVTIELRMMFNKNTAPIVSVELRDESDWTRSAVFSTSDATTTILKTPKIKLSSGGKELDTITLKDSGTWVTLRFDLDMKNNTYDTYYNGSKKVTGATMTANNALDYAKDTVGTCLKFFRVNLTGATANADKYVSIDDLRAYSTSYTYTDTENPGILVDSAWVEKNAYSFFKVGVPRAFYHGKTVDIADGVKGSPVKVNDRVYVPLASLAGAYNFGATNTTDTLSISGARTATLTVGQTAATVNGASVTLSAAPIVSDGLMMIAYEDIPAVLGLNVHYDSVGVVQISDQEITLTRETDQKGWINLISNFIYVKRSGADMISDMQKNLGSLSVHPRIQATADRFDTVKNTYYTGTTAADSFDRTISDWTKRAVTNAETRFNTYFTVASDGTVSWKDGKYFWQPYMRYTNGVPDPTDGKSKAYTDMYGNKCYGDGYDDGGRSSLNTYTSYMKQFAFAYRMTGEEKYARAVYLSAQAVGTWAHWGEGHFLNNADGAVLYATALDWTWDAFSSAELREMAQILFERAIFPTWGQFYGIYTFPSERAKAPSFANATNNWMTVCCSGEMTACITIAEYTDLTYTYKDKTYTSGEIIPETMELMLDRLPNCFGVYIPDGSYIESPAYWDYGTNTFFLMCENMMSAMGTTYGLMEAPGIDRTCYFALHIESSDYKSWNYHDGGSTAMPTKNFSFVGQYFGDDALVSLRYKQIESGKSMDYEDVLFYDPSLVTGDTGVDSPLSYYCEGIDTFVTRSSWEKGAIYAGLHAGSNNVSHGQIDSGNFILYKGNTRFFIDLGSDNYNLPNYFNNNTRYHYYRMNPEGQNTVYLAGKSGLPYGQDLNGVSRTIARGEGVNGAYSIVDMTSVYGTYASVARRGLLFTSGRRAVVIQDEMTFTEASEYYWVAHTEVKEENITISADGKTAWMTSADGRLRVTLLDPDQVGLTFTLEDAGDAGIHLDATYTKEEVIEKNNEVTGKGQQLETSRDGFRKLVVHGTGTKLNVAVVMEFIRFDSDEVDYTWTPMDSWSEATISDGTAAAKRNLVAGIARAEADVKNAKTALDARNVVLNLRAYLDTDEVQALLSTDDDLAATAELAYARADAALSAYREDVIAAREDATDMNDYKGTKIIENSFTKGSLTGELGTLGEANKNTSGANSGIFTEANGNKYYRITADKTLAETAANTYLYKGGVKIAGGDLVVECDYMAIDQFSAFDIYFRYNPLYVNGASVNPVKITNKGVINVYHKDGTVAFTDATTLKLGKWTKIAIVLHLEARTLDLYLDDMPAVKGVPYIKDGFESGYKDADKKQPVTADNFDIRFSHGGGNNFGDTGIDNVKIYRASVPLDAVHHFNRLSGRAADETVSAAERRTAIEQANALYNTGALPKSDSTVTAAKKALDTAAAGISSVEAAEAAIGSLKYNLSLFAGFDINLYLPVSGGVKAVRLSSGGPDLLDRSKITTISGVRYYVVTAGVNANDVATPVVFRIDVETADGTTATICRSLSVLGYAKAILTNTAFTAEDRTLVMAILSYADEACKLLDGLGNTDAEQLLAEHAADAPAPRTDYGQKQDVSKLATAFLGACLNLDASPDFLFYLRDDFRGKITFTYTSYSGKSVTKTVIADGTIDRVSIDTMRMYEFGNAITITVEPKDSYDGDTALVSASDAGSSTSGADTAVFTAVYDLDTYIRGVIDGGEDISDFAQAIYTYVKVSLAYKQAQDAK